MSISARTGLSLLMVYLVAGPAAAGESSPASIFDLPARHAVLVQTHAALLQSFAQQRYDAGEQVCRKFLELYPDAPEMHYNLACALALQGRTDAAFEALSKSVELGFRDPDKIREDPDLVSLRDDRRFRSVLKAAAVPLPETVAGTRTVVPAVPSNGVVTVSEACISWNPQVAAFICQLEPPPEKAAGIVGNWKGQDGIVDLLRTWHKEGTAAGNHGDFYDNHDRDHSNMAYKRFPQLTRIEYSDAVKGHKLGYNTGLQEWFIFDRPVIGNSSTAHVKGPLWRSQTRYAMTDARRMGIQALHYLSNQLYFYPEHRDYDADRGDTFPANTPYVITSQGSSGSDKAFMNAIAATMAAFKPAVKERLVERKVLVPALQQIFRMNYARGESDDVAGRYLSGAAHPVVFQSGKMDVAEMVKSAHAFDVSCLPPIALLSVAEEIPPSPKGPPAISPHSEVLFTTPGAVARVYRRMDPTFEVVLSGSNSQDLDMRDLTYHWVVLQGDPDEVSIKKLDASGREVRVSVPWFESFPVRPGREMQTHRVDVGLFVHNGTYYSAPAIYSLSRLPNETREYDIGGRLLSIDYRSKAYSDPALSVRKAWRDSFEYRPDGSLERLQRDGVDGHQEFDSKGSLIVRSDENGQPVETRPVRYAIEKDDKGVMSMRTVIGDTPH